ncbi:alpha/beta hydrolase-fold protein [Vibrio sp.]|nr:alpha/beta hydrolase-fold protein [Vibrio sp.]
MNKSFFSYALMGSSSLILAACSSEPRTDAKACPPSNTPNTVTVCITDRADKPSKSDLYIAGTHNGWEANSTIGKLKKINHHTYSYDLKFENPGDIHQFKFTRGSWDTVEVDGRGYDIANRHIQLRGQNQVINLTIEGWADQQKNGHSLGGKPTLSYGQIDEIEFVFPIDTFKRGKGNHVPRDTKRLVRVWTPEGYDKNRSSPYKVIYAFDGQNLFSNEHSSHAMEWELDEALNYKNADYIVVGLDSPAASTPPKNATDNTKETLSSDYRRYVEYSALDWEHPTYGEIEGQGFATIEFLVEQIIPKVEKLYNVSDKKSDRVVMGSSMGGYLSLIAISKRQPIFGKAIALSHATTHKTSQSLHPNCRGEACLGYGGKYIRDYIEKNGFAEDAIVYLDMGTQEVTSVAKQSEMLEGHRRMINAIQSTGIKFEHDEISNGVHDEEAWAERFPKIYDQILK